MECQPTPPERPQKTHLEAIYTAISKLKTALQHTLCPHQPLGPDYGVYLPECIRRNLRYNQGHIEKQSLRSVLNYQGFEDLSVVLSAKLLHKHPKQGALLTDIVNAMHQGTFTEHRADIIQPHLDRPGVPGDVVGTKVAQIFRVGPNAFHAKFDELIQQVKAEGKIPCLIAHSALLGLRSCIEQSKNGDHIVIIHPENLEENNGEHCGYIITINDDGCDVVDLHTTTDLNLLLPDEPAILIDDTIKSGATTKHVRDEFAKKLHFPTIEEEPIAVMYSANSAKPV